MGWWPGKAFEDPHQLWIPRQVFVWIPSSFLHGSPAAFLIDSLRFSLWIPDGFPIDPREKLWPPAL